MHTECGWENRVQEFPEESRRDELSECLGGLPPRLAARFLGVGQGEVGNARQRRGTGSRAAQEGLSTSHALFVIF